MSANNLKRLYAIVPGFRQDRDETWIDYLPHEDQTFVRRCREKFIIMKDRQDELKLQQKDQRDPTGQEFQAIGRRMEDGLRALNEFINSVLFVRLPQMKRRAEKAREDLIEKDFNAGSQEAGPSDVFGSQFASLSKSFDAFLPSHLLPAQEPPAPSPPHPPPQPQAQHDESEKPVSPTPTTTTETATPLPLREKAKVTMSDTYLDGVHSENIEIMKAMRPLIDRYDCKDRVLAALKKIRSRDHWLDILESIKESFPLNESSTTGGIDPSTCQSVSGQQQQDMQPSASG